MNRYQVICSSIGRVFNIVVEADSVEQAIAKVKQMANDQGIRNLRITATIQL